MIPSHARKVAVMPLELKLVARAALTRAGYPVDESSLLHEGLAERGLCLADLVVVLARHDHPYVPAALAHLTSYTKAPPVTPAPLGNTCPYLLSGEQDRRRVLSVGSSCPAIEGGGWERAYAAVRVGLTVSQLRSRGVTPRMLREWQRSGHVEVEA